MLAARIHFTLLIILGQSGGAWSAEKNPPIRTKNTPSTVLLIRHAEKPADDENSRHLSAAGIRRAAALVDLFIATKQRPDPLPVPDIIFVAKSSKHSQR